MPQVASRPVDESLPRLGAPRWDAAAAYDRTALPVRVLQFGTGMLLRALPLALLDAANRRGAAAGRATLVQSTGSDTADALAAQGGLFTLVERGVEVGRPVDRHRLIGSVAEAHHADRAWPAIAARAATPALRVVVSNVTEGAFRADERDRDAAERHAAGHAPHGFVGKLAAALHARFTALGDEAPVLACIPTELVDDNGAVLAALLDGAATHFPRGDAFRRWLGSRVACCSSLVDRITTGTPASDEHRALERRLGYRDALVTVTEPFAFWAVEGDPSLLRAVLPIDAASPEAVRFAPSIADARERKLRLLNGTHTALAPLALLLDHATVAAAMDDATVATLATRLLDAELVPTLRLVAPDDARAFAHAVRDRFANPSLAHAWQVIAQNQTLKLRVRLGPALRAHLERGAVPPVLALALAAHWARLRRDGADVADPGAVTAAARLATVAIGDDDAVQHAVRALLADAEAWGAPLPTPAGFVAHVATLVAAIEREGAATVAARVAVVAPPVPEATT